MALPGDKFTRIIHVQRSAPTMRGFDTLLGIDGSYVEWWFFHGISFDGIPTDYSGTSQYPNAFSGLYHKDVGPDGFLKAFQRSHYLSSTGGRSYSRYGINYRTVNLVGPIVVGDLNKSYTTPVFHGFGDLNYPDVFQTIFPSWDQYPIQLTAAELKAFKKPWDFTKYRHPDGLLIWAQITAEKKPYGRTICILGNPCPWGNYFDGNNSLLWKPLLYIYTPFTGDGETEAPTAIYKPMDFTFSGPGSGADGTASSQLLEGWRYGNRFLSYAVHAYGMGEAVDPGSLMYFNDNDWIE